MILTETPLAVNERIVVHFLNPLPASLLLVKPAAGEALAAWLLVQREQDQAWQVDALCLGTSSAFLPPHTTNED